MQANPGGEALHDLIDLIYEAGVNGERWPDVLDGMAALADAEGGVLFAAGAGIPKWVASERMMQHMTDFVSEGWAAKNSRSTAGFNKRLSSFATDYDTLEPEQIESDPLYINFFRPRGLGWSIGTSIIPLTGDVLIVSLEQRYDKGPVDNACKTKLDPLRPHLARASFFSARLGLEKARSTVKSLEMVGLAAAVISANGSVAATNDHLLRMEGVVVMRSFDRIALRDSAAHAIYNEALENIRRDGPRLSSIMSFPVRRDEGPPCIAHVVSLVASGRDIFGKGDAVLIISEIGAANVPNASLLEALFDLTPAESRVAHKAAAGVPLKAVASSLGISHETARSHMQSILRKTGARGQAELVSLVAGTPKVSWEAP